MRLWLQLSSGRGPAECCLVVARVCDQICAEAEASGLQVALLDAVAGDESGTLKSALLALDGEAAALFAASWAGTVQWIGRSPFRPQHKRKNWFIGVTTIAPPEVTQYSAQEVRFETMRASGPGGQHVNKTESAVRATHVPSGLSVVAREERSQHQNKQLALARLFAALRADEKKSADVVQQNLWEQHDQLERGNSKRVLVGDSFKQR